MTRQSRNQGWLGFLGLLGFLGALAFSQDAPPLLF